MAQDIRWNQRFSNYSKALQTLRNNIAYIKDLHDGLDLSDEENYHDIALATADIVKQGLIQSFEFTHELAWKTLKDYAEYQGNTEITGSRDAVRYAASVNLIPEAHIWMDMIVSRNKTSHTYNEGTANEIFRNIIVYYMPLFEALHIKLNDIKNSETGS